jgi:Flp pilus assembly protein TadG
MPRANKRKGRRKWRSAQSTVELAIVLPVLVLLLLATLDFGRLYYMALAVTDAARAGAQYGAQNGATAVNVLGMEQAACNSMPNLTCVAGTNAMASSFCMCSGATVSCTNPGTCATYVQNFVQVTISTTFSTVVSYPGIPRSVALSTSATMQVQ